MKEWDEIAKSFDATRKHAWEECINFMEEGDIAIDIGCGNARHLIPMAEKCKIAVGIDISFNMLKISKEKIAKKGLKNVLLVCCNACYLPFKDRTFDYALFIATLHNIKGRENRIKALEELKRILKKDGKALISVWARWQDRWRKYFFKEIFKFRREFGDIYIPWRKDGLNVKRFYHLYSMAELKKDIKKAGLKIEKAWSVRKASKKYSDNHFTIVKNDGKLFKLLHI